MIVSWPFSQEIIELSEELESQLKQIEPHLVDILKGSIQVLADINNPMRFTFSSLGFRELLRETLKRLAPDEEIKNTDWFELTEKGKVTRRDRIKYAIIKNINSSYFTDKFLEDSNSIIKDLISNINNLSKYTHVTSKILSKPHSNAQELLTNTLKNFVYMFNSIKKTTEDIKKKIQDDLNEEILMAFQDDIGLLFGTETFDELDCLSSHTRPEEFMGYELSVSLIDTNKPEATFQGKGSVCCNLQYGSDGDISRGYGAEMSMSFECSFQGTVELTEAFDKSLIVVRNVDIDTSNF